MPEKREDCWMTFSQSLEHYLVAREVLGECQVSHGEKYDDATREMRCAARHLDLLTGSK